MRPNKQLYYLNTLCSPQPLTVSERTLIEQHCWGAHQKLFTGMVGGAINNLILKIILKKS